MGVHVTEAKRLGPIQTIILFFRSSILITDSIYTKSYLSIDQQGDQHIFFVRFNYNLAARKGWSYYTLHIVAHEKQDNRFICVMGQHATAIGCPNKNLLHEINFS